MSRAALVSVDSTDIWDSSPEVGLNLYPVTCEARVFRLVLAAWMVWSWAVTLDPASQACSSSQITSFCSFCQMVSSCDTCLSLVSGLRRRSLQNL